MAGEKEDVIGMSWEDIDVDNTPDEPQDTKENELSLESEVQETPEESNISPAEELARKNGWVSLEEWTARGGDPAMHASPELFNNRGELMGRIQSQSAQLTATQKRMAELENAVKVSKDIATKAAEAERKKLLKELRTERATAITEGDAEKIVEVEELIDEVQTADLSPEESAPQEEQATPDIPPEVQSAYHKFVSENEWYQKDPYLNGVLNYVADGIHAQNPGMDTTTILEQAKKFVVQQNPNHEAFKSRKTPPRDNNGSGDGDRSGSTSVAGWNDLDDDQKAAGLTFINEGVYKDKSEYLKHLRELDVL